MFNDRFEYFDEYAKCHKVVWVENDAKGYRVYKKTKDASDARVVHESRTMCCLKFTSGMTNPIIYPIHFGEMPKFNTPVVVEPLFNIDLGFDDDIAL